MTYSSVVSLHVNPYTCGVARFNRSLAEVLQVPLISLSAYLESTPPGETLLSLKMEELSESEAAALISMLSSNRLGFSYFVHDFTESKLQAFLATNASRVFANSKELSEAIRAIRADVVAVYSPGAKVRPAMTRPDLRLLTAGMAHKIRAKGYGDLAKLLSRDPRRVRLEITTAIHEGQRFDESFFSVTNEIREVFQHEIHFCGFLSDEELSQRLHECDAYVAFFPRGVRENNTTVLSAMAHGCPVITNLDSMSPSWMRHGATLFDVGSLSEFPSSSQLIAIGAAGREIATTYNFERLAQLLKH